MNDRLFPMLVALTALDLGFVHATGVVPALELLPLWALTLGASWLRRLQQRRVYRAAWNLGVVAVFALLVHHATTTGLLHMLEDGLVLAVLCQVHLLNNVGERQRPDLIFFNSFLVAFVTSFFAPDVTWSLLFVAHAFALVPGLQLLSIARGPSAAVPELQRQVRRDATGRTLAIVGATAIAFVLLPRDFRREGWLGETLARQQPFESGLADRIRIDDEHAARLPEHVVARITPVSGQAEDVPSHWRATAFTSFDGTSWEPQDARTLGTRFATDPVWERHPDGSMRRRLAGRPRTMRVQISGDVTRLPVPLAASHVVVEGNDDVLLNPRSDGTLRCERPVQARIDVAEQAGTVAVTDRTRAHMTSLPATVPESVRSLARQLRAAVPADADAARIAAAASEWLQNNRRYQLPGQPGFARNLGEFLLGSGAGHCEYFATTLALLLRVQGVPCRLVGGYLAFEWQADTRSVVVRGKHAHAWVEVLGEDGAWRTFDPTPPADLRADPDDAGDWFAAARRRLEGWWSAVTGFDQTARTRWLAALLALPVDHGIELGAGVLLVAFVLWRRRHRRRQPSEPTVVALQRALRAAKLTWRSGETPRELLARAATADLDPSVLSRLQGAAANHEAHRYGCGARGAP